MERTISDLRQRQSLPLGAKVSMTQRRILEWVREFDESGVYVSFSGGKDSTVLLHLVRQMFPDIEAVFVDTGLEYPEIKKFVKQHENVTILRPKMGFKDVICKYGYPVLSKAISNVVYESRFGNSKSRICRINGELLNRDGTKSKYNCEKYKPLLNADFLVSDKCCSVMKKSPIHSYERKANKKPITAQMADESLMRTQVWLKQGCNAFDAKHQISNPMSFWTEQDVLQYIKQNNIEICSVYGDIIPEGGKWCSMVCRANSAQQDAKERAVCSADTVCILKRARGDSRGSNERTRSCTTTASAVELMIRRTGCGSRTKTG